MVQQLQHEDALLHGRCYHWCPQYSMQLTLFRCSFMFKAITHNNKWLNILKLLLLRLCWSTSDLIITTLPKTRDANKPIHKAYSLPFDTFNIWIDYLSYLSFKSKRFKYLSMFLGYLFRKRLDVNEYNAVILKWDLKVETTWESSWLPAMSLWRSLITTYSKLSYLFVPNLQWFASNTV